MRLAALFSGGKDSTYAILAARELGHEVSCLVTLHPPADDSLLFHYPNVWITRYQSEAMQIPLLKAAVKGRSKDEEAASLGQALGEAKSAFGVEGILSGGISSIFQKDAFESVCGAAGLSHLAPNWGSDPEVYMNRLLDKGFEVMLVGVSAMGLDRDWLGKVIDRGSLERLRGLSKKYGFNLDFEGGEAETLVLDCPLFQKKLVVKQGRARWDGQRGMFEIQEVALEEK